MKKTIYLDNAATTKTRPEVVEAMLPYFTEFYGNPSSIYSFSDEPKKAVANGREIIAKSIGAKTNELYFTGGGSESDNWALKATRGIQEQGQPHHHQQDRASRNPAYLRVAGEKRF